MKKNNLAYLIFVAFLIFTVSFSPILSASVYAEFNIAKE